MIAVAIVVMAACGGPAEPPVVDDGLWIADDIVERRAQFVRQVLEADVSHLSDGDRAAVGHLVEAARIMDEVFRVQVWRGNPGFAEKVATLEGPLAIATQDYFRIMMGPWDRLAEFESFVGDVAHPAGAGYYPDDMSADEFETWLDARPQDREAFTSLHTMIVRSGDGLAAVPYSDFFAEPLARAAEALRAAAAATDNASLRRFLELRAAAFATDDYFESDMAWMDLDSAIEVVIGPYETYEDRLFGYKAAFEAFVCVTSPEDSAALAKFKAELPFLESSLPIPDEHKNFDRGSESPIRVADEIFTGGDANAGVRTLAFNLPNDERVREAKGSKKVLLKNIMRAKYDAILAPIAAEVLPADDLDRLDFEAYFQFILHHELSHGLGPGLITVDGRETEVRLELRDLYSAIEEAKADALGVYDIKMLVDTGVMDAEILEHLPWTYTAGLFRSARFGVTEAHGLGVVLQTNILLANGALEVTEDGRFRPVPERFFDGVRDLSERLLMVQALGDYEGAVQLVEEFGAVADAMRAGLDRLSSIPVDVDPVHPLEGVS
jgi:hypothetical protein